MANPENLKPWKKGTSGNPKGSTKFPKEFRNLRTLTNEQLKQIGDTILLGTRDDITKILQDRKSSPLMCAIASVVNKLIQKGDVFSLNALLDRLVGKVSDKLQIESGPIPLAILVGKDGTARDQEGNVIDPASVEFSPTVPPFVIEKQSGEKEVFGISISEIKKK